MKRIKSVGSTNSNALVTWKVAKIETASSPSALTNEYLEEMGIGMLESEESSSSASAFALAVNTSTDENSNEATPNLDAPKFCHQRITYRSIDNTLDSSTDNANGFIDANEGLTSKHIGASVVATATTTTTAINNSQYSNNKSYNNINNNNSNNINFAILSDEHRSSEKITLTQHKKVAILGAGAGIISAPIAHNTNSNSPSNGRNVRSPLATVACNSYFRNAKNIHSQQQQQQSLNTATSNVGTNTTPHAVVGGTTSQCAQRSISPSLPSTSHQAALMKQQQQLHQLQLQKQQHLLQQQKEQQQNQYQQQHHHLHQHQQQQTHFVPNENFFLFRNQAMRDAAFDGKDHFNCVSDEMVLQIFKWLPKKTLMRCAYVCRRFQRCAGDESLWTRLDLGNRSLRAGALEYVLTRGVVVLRLAQAELNHPVFEPHFLESSRNYNSKLQYLDLSMVSITKQSLKMLLSRCRQLKKLSLEHVGINDEICNEIARNTNLEALNLAMCTGLEAWSVRKIMESLQNMNSLNISWTNLSVDAITSLVTNVTPNILRLNVAGCRKTMFDSHLSSLAKRCPQLLELDLSDCTGLTGNAITIICEFKMLEYLSLSRCYLIPASAYMELNNLRTLTFLDVFGMLSEAAMEMLERNFPGLGINKFIHSSVARPTVGTRRTSIWGLRTRD